MASKANRTEHLKNLHASCSSPHVKLIGQAHLQIPMRLHARERKKNETCMAASLSWSCVDLAGGCLSWSCVDLAVACCWIWMLVVAVCHPLPPLPLCYRHPLCAIHWVALCHPSVPLPSTLCHPHVPSQGRVIEGLQEVRYGFTPVNECYVLWEA